MKVNFIVQKSKPKKSSSLEKGSSCTSTVDRRRCHLHLCHGCRRDHLSRECHFLFRQGYSSCENFVPLGMLRV